MRCLNDAKRNSGKLWAMEQKKMNKHSIYGHFDRCRCFGVSIHLLAMRFFTVGDFFPSLFSFIYSTGYFLCLYCIWFGWCFFLFVGPVYNTTRTYCVKTTLLCDDGCCFDTPSKKDFFFDSKQYLHLFHL